VFTRTDGFRYEGDWVRNLWEGQGVYVGEDDYVYNGQYEAGKKHGKGRLTHSNGYTYTGEWVGDKAHGEGMLTDVDGSVLFKGQWKEGFHCRFVGFHCYCVCIGYQISVTKGQWMARDYQTGKV
jgi:hypothetical protein